MTAQALSVSHPLIDLVHDDAVFSESSASVVELTAARAGLLRLATERSRRVVLLTGEGSLLTLPMRDALLATGGVWVVKEGNQQGGRDAVTGRQLDNVLEATRPSDPPTLEATSPVFLGETPTDVGPDALRDLERRRTVPTARLVNLSMSVRHSARRTTVLGRTAELAIETLTGAPPRSWGRHEPALVAWNRTALTADARERAPLPARFVVVADGVIGTVLVRRTDDGLEETTTLELTVGPSGSDAARAVVDRVPDLFDALAEETVPLFFLATIRTGRADLLVPSEAQELPVPLAMLLGPPGVRRLGVDLDVATHRFGAVRVGKRRLPALRFPLGTFDHADWDTASEVASWLDADEALAAVSGPSPARRTDQLQQTGAATDGA